MKGNAQKNGVCGTPTTIKKKDQDGQKKNNEDRRIWPTTRKTRKPARKRISNTKGNPIGWNCKAPCKVKRKNQRGKNALVRSKQTGSKERQEACKHADFSSQDSGKLSHAGTDPEGKKNKNGKTPKPQLAVSKKL